MSLNCALVMPWLFYPVMNLSRTCCCPALPLGIECIPLPLSVIVLPHCALASPLRDSRTYCLSDFPSIVPNFGLGLSCICTYNKGRQSSGVTGPAPGPMPDPAGFLLAPNWGCRAHAWLWEWGNHRNKHSESGLSR